MSYWPPLQFLIVHISVITNAVSISKKSTDSRVRVCARIFRRRHFFEFVSIDALRPSQQQWSCRDVASILPNRQLCW